jgi:hypothetical protein
MRLAFTAMVVALAACGANESTGFPPEELGRCADFDPLRRPLYGDTHVHTTVSLDANVQGTRLRPVDAYRFALGEEVGVQPHDAEGNPTRTVRLRSPLDFVALSDHAEFFGTVHGCTTPGSTIYDRDDCVMFRESPDSSFFVLNFFVANPPELASYPGVCGSGGELCRDLGDIVWREIRDAAEEAYDRDDTCGFTSFVAYEWSGSPNTANWHRNVIFRNEHVPERPISYFDEPRPEELWRLLKEECIDGDPRCDVLAIPHNTNLSNGSMMTGLDSEGAPYTAFVAALQAELEPIIEIYQHKGDSECLPELGGPDELCGFEKLPYTTLSGANQGVENEPIPADYVRNILAEGLRLEAELDVNPFAFGIVASTDTHLGTPGLVDEEDFPGHAGAGTPARDELPPGLLDDVSFSPGGLAGVWAEENSREAIFLAMRRKETFGTSGPRIPIRFFGARELPEGLCDDVDRVAKAYEAGVPMGGTLEPSAGAPTFAAWAAADPESAVGLERLQIVKITLEEGAPEVELFEVAGDATGEATVDEACNPVPAGGGAAELCAVFTDPDYDPSKKTIYYARAIENPTCRWHAFACLSAGVDCDEPETITEGFGGCCDPRFPHELRERAWSSPIWVEPSP